MAGAKVKTPGRPRRDVCLLCGKPSKQIICEGCEAKVRGEALDKKMQTEKAGK